MQNAKKLRSMAGENICKKMDLAIKKYSDMKFYQHLQPDGNGSLFLYGAIMFANIDYVGIMDYAIKAAIGGSVWFAFKLLQDYYSPRVKRHSIEQIEKEKTDTNENETGK